jgi:dihydroxy-acid dehydratase
MSCKKTNCQNGNCTPCSNNRESIWDESNPSLNNFNKRSNELTGQEENREDWVKRTAARAMMRAVGFKDGDFKKPLVAIAAPFAKGITPCNEKILELAENIQEEVERLGMKGFYFGTPVVTDGETMGMTGMRYSLPSRDLIADCIEMMTEAYSVDASITLSGCDKTIPGALMPIARNNLVGITLYGGSILPGHYKGKDLNIVSTFEAVGQYSAGKIDYEDFMEVERRSCPTCGACGGMYTANTMASGIEALGMSLPYSSSNPATNAYGRVSEEKYEDCLWTARALVNLIKKNIRARDIMTRKAFENALTLVFALGGSTNAVQHFLALAKEAEVDLKIEDFNEIGSKVPLIADLKPSGKFLMFDVFKIGGVPMVLKHLLKQGLIHGDCLTVTGKTVAENLESTPDLENYLEMVKENQKDFLNKTKQNWIKEILS